MNKELPTVVFMTNSLCHHCIKFRGRDGRPKQNDRVNNLGSNWNYDYIRSILNDYPSHQDYKIERRSNAIVEIHLSSYEKESKNIQEVNMYISIPTIDQISKMYRSGKVKSMNFFNDVDNVGNSIQRISFKRGMYGSIDIKVEIDGIYSPRMSEIITDEYIWNHVPDDLKNIRDKIKKKSKVDESLFNNITNPKLRDMIKSYYEQCKDNINLFDKQIVINCFNYDWLLSRIIPENIINYAEYFPIWMLTSVSEWKESIKNQERPIFARVLDHVTVKNKHGGYELISFKEGSSEDIDYLLDQYQHNKIKLHVDSNMNMNHKYSWQQD